MSTPPSITPAQFEADLATYGQLQQAQIAYRKDVFQETGRPFRDGEPNIFTVGDPPPTEFSEEDAEIYAVATLIDHTSALFGKYDGFNLNHIGEHDISLGAFDDTPYPADPLSTVFMDIGTAPGPLGGSQFTLEKTRSGDKLRTNVRDWQVMIRIVGRFGMVVSMLQPPPDAAPGTPQPPTTTTS
ncbi:MAG TPA: hypothetical protein VLF40_01495 [Candidatus Saccharimonadales bacterium]|nr:hypothetical protein [Candidatus Saccharimonadales bacterium]